MLTQIHSVTLLDNFEEVNDPLDWELGTHGIIAKFTIGGEDYSSTFLPSVAVEQGWTKETTLNALVKKAGIRGKTYTQIPTFSITRYTGDKSTLTYEEYLEFKKEKGL